MKNDISMTFFSASYTEAQAKFRQAANRIGATVKSVQLGEGLEVDVATLGGSDKPTLIISTGLHGVEAYFGSAVQLAIIDNLQHFFDQRFTQNDVRIVLVHGINPYGFANIRRVDENNVDLNRNFPRDTQQYQGAAQAYKNLNSFLNPQSRPSVLEPYRLRAAFNIVRYGLPALKEAIVCGQYEYPMGIFYGGSEPSIATQFVMNHCTEWVANAATVAHIDLHSGLGEFGKYKILINETPDVDGYSWYLNAFGEDSVTRMDNDDELAYAVSGAMGAWLQEKFSDRKYYFAGAEFGTYDPVRVVGALRAENRVHHYAAADSKAYNKAKSELLECFCPASEVWRRQVVSSSLQIISSAIDALHQTDGN